MGITAVAWAAGVVDGEGCIRVDGAKPTLLVSNTDYHLLARLRSIIGGHIYRQGHPKKPHHKQAWQLKLQSSKDSYAALTLLLPFLVTKKGEAELLLEWIDAPAVVRPLIAEKIKAFKHPVWVPTPDGGATLLGHILPLKVTN